MADTTYNLDFEQAIKALDQLGAADARLRAEAVKTGEAYKKSFSEAAAAAVDAQNKIAAATQEQQAARAVVTEQIAALRQLREAQKQLNAEAKDNPAAERARQLSVELKRNQQEQDKLRQLIAESRVAYQQEGQAVQQVREEVRKVGQEQKLVAAAGKDAATAAKQLAQQEKEAAAAAEKAARAAGILTQLEQKLTDLTERRARATSRTEVRGYNQQIKDTQKQIADLKGEADKTGGAVGGMFGRFTGAAGAAAAVGIVISFVKNLADQAIDAGKKADATLGKLQFARGGDLEKAAGDMAALSYEANRLGLDINAAGASYGSFTAAAAAGNLPLAEARRLYLAIGGAAAVLKVSSENTQGALLALQQMVSKGTVSAEELRGQLGERLPGAFSIAARAIGVTEKELGKMLQRGEIVASDFLPKFARELEKTFGDGTAQAADSLQANTNRIDNEWQRFLLRFTSATGRAVSAIAKFAKQANDFLDGLTPEGQEGLAASRTAAFVKRYQDRLEKLLDQTAQGVKAKGGNVAEAVENTLDINQARLKKNLEEAEALQKQYTNQQFIVDNGGYNKVGPLRDANLERIALLRGELQVLEDVRAARKKSADDEEKNLQGLIEKQQLLIKSLQDRQKAARIENRQQNTGQGGDYLFGKGGLNEQLTAAQKRLDFLLGKVDKPGPDKLAAALRALEVERRKLQKEFDKAELEDLRDQGQAKAKEQLRQDFNAIKAIENNLKAREAAVKKAGGSGTNADGIIDGVQAERLARLRQLATEKYYEGLRKIAQDHADKLFALEAESRDKEREAIERNYARQAFEARGQADLLVAIEAAKQRELLALQFSQSTQDAEQSRAIGISVITETIGQNFGQGTGSSVIEAKRAEQKALLELDQVYQQKSLNNTLLLSGKEAEIQRAAIKARQAEITQALNAIEAEKKKHEVEDFLYKLVLGEEDSDENRRALDQAVSETLNAVSQLLQAQVASEQAKIDARSRNIDDLNTRLLQEIALNKAGSASNIGTLREQLEQEKAARREAVKEKRKAAKEQVLIDTLLQVSSVTAAAANALNAFPIPFVGPFLGIAAAGAIVAAFIASRVKAYNAADKASEGFFKGGYTGDGHEHAESKNLGPKSYTYHNKEYVLDHELTAQYRHALLEPLHQRRPQDIDWSHPSMRELLPDLSLPARVQAEKQAAAEIRVTHQFSPMQAQFDAMNSRLEAIERNTGATSDHTGTTARRKDVIPMPDGYMTVDPATRSTNRVRLQSSG